MPRKKKFPSTVYVRWEDDEPGEQFLLASDAPTDCAVIGESVEVAIYQFVHMAKISADVTVG